RLIQLGLINSVRPRARKRGPRATDCGRRDSVSVMAGHSRPKDGVLPHAYVPAIHVFSECRAVKTWMPGTRHVLGLAFGRARVPGMPGSYMRAAGAPAGNDERKRRPGATGCNVETLFRHGRTCSGHPRLQ